MPDILTQLAQLADLHTRLEGLRLAQEAALPQSLRQRLKEIEARFGPQRETLEHEARHLEADIKAAVIAHGASVKGARLHAVYVSGKVSWDDRALQGYAAAGHAEILTFRSLGKASVSLRKATWESASPKGAALRSNDAA
jgi:hypothetical protein